MSTAKKVTRATPDKSIDIEVGRRVHMRMWDSKLTHEAVARSIGLDTSSFSKRLRGERKWALIELVNVATVLRTTSSYLLGHLQGFRVSQIARVRGDDIDTKAMMIRTVAKGGKVRRLPLHPLIAQIAEDMPAGWWFPARNGRDAPILAASVTDLISSAKRRAGITDLTLTPHSLRHAFGCELSDAEVDIRVIQELLLHEQLSTTQLYTRVSDRRKTAGLAHLRPVAVPLRSGRSAA